MARRAAGHVAGSFGAWTASAVTSLIYVAISSRVFDPQAIGGYAAGVLAETLVYLAVGSGLAVGVQRQLDPGAASSGAYVTRAIACGLAAAVVLLAGGGAWASLWSAPEAAEFTRVFAIVALFHPLGQVAIGMLRSEAEHGKAARVIAIAGVGSSLLGIVPVVVFRDPLTLVASNALVWAIAIAVAVALGVRLTPARSLRVEGESFIHKSVALNLGNWFAYNGVAWAVSRFISVATLGLYSRTWLLADLPAQGAASAAAQVMFPSLARMSDEEHRGVAAEALVAVTAFAALLLGVIAASASLAVRLLLGKAWLDAVPLLAVLGISLSAMAPQWLLSTQFQSRVQFRELAGSRVAGILLTAAFMVAVAISGDAIVAAAGAGAVHMLLHSVDLRTASRIGLVKLGYLLRSYALMALAMVPLWALAVLQAAGIWQPRGAGGLAVLAAAAGLAAMISLRLLMRGPAGDVIEARGLLPGWVPAALAPGSRPA